MRILHLCLACFYIDGYNYQENVLPRIAKEKGNEVMIIASTETYISNLNLSYLEPSEYCTEYGVPIKRIPYKKIISDSITHKLRLYENLYSEIEAFNPDIIFTHDVNYLSLLEVIKYVKKHSNVCLLADSHTAYFNSGQNWLSMNILHKVIYKAAIRKAVPYIKKYYYIGPSSKDFSKDVYGVPDDLMEYMPLGGIIPDPVTKKNNRELVRKQYGIKDDEILLIHSGKLTSEKRTTDLLKAFSKSKNLNAKLLIIGSIPEYYKEEFNYYFNNDNRIIYAGWHKSEYLLKCLCACDLYCQPGSPSATLQNAICCGSAILSKPLDGYKLMDKGNFIWVESEADIKRTFEQITSGIIDLDKLKSASNRCAYESLDYYNMEEKIRNQYFSKEPDKF